MTSKAQIERFVGKWQIDNFGLFFVENKDVGNEIGNWIVFFFKKKITPKYLKITRSSEPRVPPLNGGMMMVTYSLAKSNVFWRGPLVMEG